MPARLLAGLVLVLALALAGCSSGAETSAPVSSPDSDDATPSVAEAVVADPGPRPEVGECHALSWRQALAPEARVDPVRCRKPHTAQTFAVGRLDLDSGARRGGLRAGAAAGPAHLHRAAAPPPRRVPARPAAQHGAGRLVHPRRGAGGGGCELVPLRRGRRRGAEEAAATATAYEGLGHRPRDRHVRDRGAGHEGLRPRDVRHQALLGGGGDGGPARSEAARTRQVQARMDPVCRGAARARASDPLSFTWSQESPTQEQWDAGRRYGICWAPGS